MRVHGGYGYCDCGDGGCGGGDCVVGALEGQQKRPKACYQAADHALCQEHENQKNRVAALQPEQVYARPEWWTCHAPRGHDYDIRRTIKKGKTSLA